MAKLDQASFDRAVAVLLELAESEDQSEDMRFSAASTLIGCPGAYGYGPIGAVPEKDE
jgi:hypothetical protein